MGKEVVREREGKQLRQPATQQCRGHQPLHQAPPITDPRAHGPMAANSVDFNRHQEKLRHAPPNRPTGPTRTKKQWRQSALPCGVETTARNGDMHSFPLLNGRTACHSKRQQQATTLRIKLPPCQRTSSVQVPHGGRSGARGQQRMHATRLASFTRHGPHMEHHAVNTSSPADDRESSLGGPHVASLSCGRQNGPTRPLYLQASAKAYA